MLHDHVGKRVTVSDEAGESPTHFLGVLLGPEPAVGQKVDVGVWVNKSSGFGWDPGLAITVSLKRLHDDVYGAGDAD